MAAPLRTFGSMEHAWPLDPVNKPTRTDVAVRPTFSHPCAVCFSRQQVATSITLRRPAGFSSRTSSHSWWADEAKKYESISNNHDWTLRHGTADGSKWSTEIGTEDGFLVLPEKYYRSEDEPSRRKPITKPSRLSTLRESEAAKNLIAKRADAYGNAWRSA